ncbi:MAG: hypothetical protein ACRD2R_09180, partial [Terriglobales bacterium]
LYEDIQRPNEAEAAARKAAELFHEQQRPDEEAAAYNFLALLRLGLGKVAEAEKLAATASKLLEKSTNASKRLAAEITATRLLHASGKSKEALRRLAKLIDTSRKQKLILREYEARLAQGEIELAAGMMGLGRSHLTALAKDARAKGYENLAHRAEAILKG